MKITNEQAEALYETLKDGMSGKVIRIRANALLSEIDAANKPEPVVDRRGVEAKPGMYYADNMCVLRGEIVTVAQDGVSTIGGDHTGRNYFRQHCTLYIRPEAPNGDTPCNA